jgi:DNA-binding beta-propeller fold protein YncE
MNIASFQKKAIAVALGILLAVSYLPIIGSIFAEEGHGKGRISDFGVKLAGNEGPLGSFVGPTWLAHEGNRIYIVDSINTRVQAILKGGKPQYSFGHLGSHEFLMSDPGGLTCFQNKIYWLDRFYGKILVRGNRTDDVIEKELHAINPETGESYMVNPSDISAYGGLLYIANTGAKNIIAIDLKDRLALTIPTTDGENYTLIKPTGICATLEKIFVTDSVAGKIICFDDKGKFVSSFADGKTPHGITIHDNRLYTTDYSENKIRVYAFDGTVIDSFGSPGNGRGQISGPTGITILDEKIYVSSYNNNRVDIFKLDGTFIQSMPENDSESAGSLGLPVGIAMSNGTYAVADSARCKILTFNSEGFVSEFGKKGTGTNELLSPVGLDFDSSGNIYVADEGNHCIKMFNDRGSYQKTIGSFGLGNGKLNSPSDVAVSSSLGKIYVTDTGNNLIQIFSTSGEFLAQFGGFGSAPGEFNLPKGIATDGRKLLVADSANCRLQEFDMDGTPIRQYGHKGRGEGMLFFPTDCAYDESGMIYAADTFNDRFVVFDNNSNRSWDFGKTGGPKRAMFFSKAGYENAEQDSIEYEEAKGFFIYPEAIACGSQGIIVADTRNHRIQIVPYKTIFNIPRIDIATFISQPDLNVYFTVAPNNLDFGVMSVGDSMQKRIEIRNWTGGMLTGSIDVIQNAPFVSVEPKNFVGDTIMINVKVDTNNMAAGDPIEATLVIKTNKGTKEIKVTVIPSDAFGFTLSPDTTLFVELDSDTPGSLEIEILPQNGFEGNVSLSYRKPKKKCVVPDGSENKHPNRDVKNVDCSGFALTALNVSFEPSTIRSKETTKSTIVLKSRGELTPGVYEMTIIMQSGSAQNKSTTFTFILLVNPPTKESGYVPRCLLTETFTAVWCQYCPYHREAQYRMAEEYGYSLILPIAYYADAPKDHSGMTQEEHHYRYKWYTKEGLPTTMYNGLQNFSEGDGPFERQDRAPDILPDRKMSGSSYSFWRFYQRVVDYKAQRSPIKLFLQGTIGKSTGFANLEIETYQDVSNFNDLNVYFTLVENNVEFSADNGEEEHSLTVMKMLHHLGEEPPANKGHLGDPIALPIGVSHYDMEYKLPTTGTDYDWTTLYKNCLLVAWIQDNTTKEILQSTYCNLMQPLFRKYSLTQAKADFSVQAGSRPKQAYVLTNLGNIPMDFQLDMNHTYGEAWENIVMIDSVPTTNGKNIKLYPMQSVLIEVSMDVPIESPEGTESNYTLTVSELASGTTKVFDMNMFVEPAKPPSFEIKPIGMAVVDVAPGQTTEFKIAVESINEYDNPVNLSLGPESSEFFSATFSPTIGVPPFESIVSLKTNQNMSYIEDGYKISLKGAGSNSRGEPFDKFLEMKAKAKKLDVELLPERHIITSCAINDICKQTEVKVNVKGGLEVKSASLDFVYDDQYLDITHISLGGFLTRAGEQPVWNYDHSPGRISVTIRREQTAVFADRDENILVAFTLKAKGDKLQKEGIRIGIENANLIDANGNSVIVITHDASLAIRQNAEPPKIELFGPKKLVAPWPTVEEAMRRREEGDYNYSDLETNEPSILLKGKIKSDEGLSQITFFVNGNIIKLSRDGSFEYSHRLRAGFNNIVIIAKNFTGESDAITLVVYLDNEPPTLTVIEPNENLLGMDNSMTTGESTIEFMGYTDEGTKLTIMGEPVKVQEDTFTKEDSKRWYFEKNVVLASGLNEITISACDSFDNCRTNVYKITFEQGAVSRIRLKLWVNSPKFVINEKSAPNLDPMPTTESPPLPPELVGNSYMPVRSVFEALGADVQWIDDDRRVDIKLGNTFLQLWIDNVSTAKINGREVKIIGADGKTILYPTIVTGRTMLPLRFACESLSADVNWIAEEKAIEIVYPGE